MKQNVGGLDRIGRIVIGVALVLAGVAALAGYWAIGTVVGVFGVLIGVILLATAAAQKCPINEAAGIDTSER